MTETDRKGLNYLLKILPHDLVAKGVACLKLRLRASCQTRRWSHDKLYLLQRFSLWKGVAPSSGYLGGGQILLVFGGRAKTELPVDHFSGFGSQKGSDHRTSVPCRPSCHPIYYDGAWLHLVQKQKNASQVAPTPLQSGCAELSVDHLEDTRNSDNHRTLRTASMSCCTLRRCHPHNPAKANKP